MCVKKLSVAVGIMVLTTQLSAIAGGPPPTLTTVGVAGSTTETVNRGYAGLKWTLGEGLSPALVVGYRHARVQSEGDTQGGDVSFSFNLLGGFQAGKLRAKYFNGRENLQGEIGGGYDFSKGIFAGVGVQGPFVNLGVDYLPNGGSAWEPTITLNSLRKYDKPNGITPKTILGCPAHYVLIGNFCNGPIN